MGADTKRWVDMIKHARGDDDLADLLEKLYGQGLEDGYNNAIGEAEQKNLKRLRKLIGERASTGWDQDDQHFYMALGRNELRAELVKKIRKELKK